MPINSSHTQQQTYHVKELTVPVPGGLDFNVADEDEFSPDKLRSGVERLYMEVVSRWAKRTPCHFADMKTV